MNRSSLRKKQYRPVSADFSKISGSLTSMFNNDNEKPTSNNVMLINYKKAVTEIDRSPPDSPYISSSSSSPFIRSFKGRKVTEEIKEVIGNENDFSNNEDRRTTKDSQTDLQIETQKTKETQDTSAKECKLGLSKSFSSGGSSWESEEEEEEEEVDRPPLASEDSDLGDMGEFESFSGTDDEDEMTELGDADISTFNGARPNDNGRLSFFKNGSLREKLKESRSWSIRRNSEKDLSTSSLSLIGNNSINIPSTPTTPGEILSSESRLSRLFSLRRSLIVDSPQDKTENGMPQLSEEEEVVDSLKTETSVAGRLISSPTLPPTPLLLSQDQTKRRYILNSLVISENNYLSSLNRLINDYKVPLEKASPPILSQAKVDVLFHRIQEIFDLHSNLRMSLTDAVRKWDKEEKIGDIFVTSFSKPGVLKFYSDFINNFNKAMEMAKSESKRKSAFADFLKVKQITAGDRLNFFGLMVKPVQRFPQFILLLQDLLKETPQGHQDRISLQLALTTLESLAEMLNERKRESEQSAAFQAKLRSAGNKLNRGVDGDQTRILIREDDCQQLEFNNCGQVSRSKPRRLLLLNDQLVCVAVSGRPSEVEIGGSFNSQGERLNVKWAARVEEVDLVEGSSVGTLARLTLAGSVSSNSKRSSLSRVVTPVSGPKNNGSESGHAESLAQDMADLMHDFDVVSRMNTMISSLKCSYPGISTDTTGAILTQIQNSIRQKDEEMSWQDKSCLHLAVKRKEKMEAFTFQMASPSVKEDWVVEHRMSRLAMDSNNSPGWDLIDQPKIGAPSKLPLFVNNLSAYQCSKEIQTEVICGCSYTISIPTPTRSLRPVTYAWINVKEGTSSHLRIFLANCSQQISLKDLGSILLPSCHARSLIHVPEICRNNSPSTDQSPKADQVWVATSDRRILFYSATDPERGLEMGRVILPAEPLCLLYHCGQVWAGLANGTLSVFKRSGSGAWDTNNPATLLMGPDPITSLIPVSNNLFVSTGKQVMVMDVWKCSIVNSLTVSCVEPHLNGSIMSLDTFVAPGSISQMAVAGVGLWVALANSSIISLYHTESLIHMQNIDVANNVKRVLEARDVNTNRRSIYVTALSASKGLLWIGTNVGIALTIPLPRLEGAPIISGNASISHHAHFGPVRMFLSLSTVVQGASIEPEQTLASSSMNTLQVNKLGNDLNLRHYPTIEEQSSQQRTPNLRKQASTGHIRSMCKAPFALTKQYSSPLPGPPQSNQQTSSIQNGNNLAARRASKTLPRGFSLANAAAGEGLDSVYGLYGDLLNVRDYECDSADLGQSCQDNHRSDPELNTIPYRVSTLDRRVTMKSQRPRSLDLSSWSVESRASSQNTSSSDNSSDFRYSPCVSRNASFLSTISSNAGVSEEYCSSPLPDRGGSTVLRRRVSSCRRVGVSNKVEKKEVVQRTVTTIMGGRGYIRWGNSQVDQDKKSNIGNINNRDAYLVIWDHKL